MQMRVGCVLIAAAVTGCGVAEVTNQAAAAPDCSTLPGVEGVRVYARLDRHWEQFKIERSELVRRELGQQDKPASRIPRNDFGLNVPSISFSREYSRFGDRTLAGEEMGYPAKISPDGQWFAASILTTAGKAPRSLILRSTREKMEVRISPEWPIDTLTWAPRSNRIAIVETSHDKTLRSGTAVLASVFGWRVDFNDVAISIYSTSGNLLCRSVLITKKAEVSTLVEWLE